MNFSHKYKKYLSLRIIITSITRDNSHTKICRYLHFNRTLYAHYVFKALRIGLFENLKFTSCKILLKAHLQIKLWEISWCHNCASRKNTLLIPFVSGFPILLSISVASVRYVSFHSTDTHYFSWMKKLKI